MKRRTHAYVCLVVVYIRLGKILKFKSILSRLKVLNDIKNYTICGINLTACENIEYLWRKLTVYKCLTHFFKSRDQIILKTSNFLRNMLRVACGNLSNKKAKFRTGVFNVVTLLITGCSCDQKTWTQVIIYTNVCFDTLHDILICRSFF